MEDVEADAAVRVDVGMEHLGQELHHRRLVGILLAELQGQLERSILTSALCMVCIVGMPILDFTSERKLHL